MLKLGTHKNLDVEFHNKIWAEELWEAQKLIIDQQRKIEGVVFAILKYPTDFENSLSNKVNQIINSSIKKLVNS